MRSASILLGLLFFLLGLPFNSYTQLLRNGMPTMVQNPDGEIYRERIQRFLVKADNLFRQGNYLEALNQLDLAVEASPQNPEVYLHRAQLRYRLGMETEANRDIELVARMSPVATDLFGINGPKSQLDLLAFYPEDLYMELSWDDRMAAYETLLLDWYDAISGEEVTDDMAELEAAASHLAIILESIAQQDWYRAERELDHLSLIRATTSTVYDLEGLIAMGKNDLEEATIFFRMAIQQDPLNAIAWCNLGVAQRQNNFVEGALASINKAIELSPTLSMGYFERALLHKEKGNLEEALKDYSTITMLEGVGHLPTLFNRSLTFKKMGKFSAAINDLDFIVQLESEEATPYKVRGNIYLLTGYYNKAIHDFTTAIEKDNDLAEAYFNRAVAHLLNYDVLPACLDFEESAARGYERGTEKQVYFCSN